MPEISAAKTSRKVAFTQLARLAEKIEVDGGNWTEIQISIKISLLDQYLSKFENVQCLIEQSEISEIAQRDKFEDIFASLKEKLIILRETRLREARSCSVNSTSFSQHSGRTKSMLPPVQLTKFDGSYTKWSDFSNMFKTLIDDDARLSPIEKFQMLRSCLIPPASSIIQSLECTEENYLKALDLLKKRYDNTRLIFGSHVKELLNAAPIQKGSIQQLRGLVDLINVEMRALQSLGTKDQIADAILINITSNKLDSATKARWEESADLNKIPSWGNFVEFLQNRCQTLEHVHGLQLGQENVASSRKRSHSGKLTAHVSQHSKLCNLCHHNDHFLYKCPQYLTMEPKERYKSIRRLKLCINCLRSGHVVRDCKGSTCTRCSQRHHTTLHFNSFEPAGPGAVEHRGNVSKGALENSSNSAPTKNCLSVTSMDGPNDPIIATITAEVISPTGVKTTCRILLDSASQSHFITERLVQQLCLRKQQCRSTLSGIGLIGAEAKSKAQLRIKSHYMDVSFAVEALVLKRITAHQPAEFINVETWPIPANIKLADSKFNQPGRIDILLGAEHFMRLLCVGQIELGHSLPVLQKTVFGWVVSGGGPANGQGNTHRSQYNCLTSQEKFHYDKSLHEVLKNFWEVEEVQPPRRVLSSEEGMCEEHFRQTTTRDDNGRFIVRLPFKEDPESLGCSFTPANRRFQLLEKKFERNTNLRDQYGAFMEEYERLRHMELSSETASNSRRHYLPHHGIEQISGGKKKLRVVFDASCKTSTGKSLNDILMVGPVVQDDLFTILCRFRRHRFVATADIVKMYRQIGVHPEHARFQSILWRNEQTNDIRTYQLNTVTYGTASAPYLATKCISVLGETYKKEYPRAARALQSEVYVDDILTGADTVRELNDICDDLTTILGRAGMSLHKWCSNSNQLLRKRSNDGGQTIEFQGEEQNAKTLGMTWQPRTDKFTYGLRKDKIIDKVTKRGVLSVIASLFDPLGLINPVIVAAKLFMKELWKLKLDWDESLPFNLHSKWNKFIENLKAIDKIKIDRAVSILHREDVQIHGFCDASLEAFGACIFIRSNDNQNQTSVKLLCSKSRVAPTKVQTLPRLELCAAVLLAELLNKVITSLGDQYTNIVCWSDSTVTLAWIAKPSSEWSTFVSHRVATIQRISELHSFKWRHVQSEENPADILSRGATPVQLIGNELWFNGPKFLSNDEQHWPKLKRVEEVTLDKRKCRTTLLCDIQRDVVASSKFVNSYRKVIRVFAYVKRFITACKRSQRFSTKTLSADELTSGEKLIIKSIQNQHFTKEMGKLLRQETVPKASHISSLDPYLDEELIIRVGGRLHNANIEFDTKHPILLPRSHQFTKAMVQHLHEKHSHVGCLTLHCIIRQRFWIPNGRQLIRSVLHNCVRCFRTSPKLPQQLMGSLPKERVQSNYPFYHTGIDFCGPFFIKQGGRAKAKTKAYIALFICLSTKAVHLELVSNLSTDAFISALKRFIGRRGKCGSIASDNATNFVGAKRELKDLKKLFFSQGHTEMVNKFCQDEDIQWRFIPPRSPHFGGLWEASIKKAKHLLVKMMRQESLNFEDFNTIIIQIESILNSRPLTPLSSDPNDMQALTPAHFLIGRHMSSIPEPDLTDIKATRLSRWQHLNRLHQSFWNRWCKEYLSTLQQRYKWRYRTRNVTIGELALLKDENLPPSKWILGRITKTISGDDGQTRVVDIKTPHGLYRRAIQKICVLPMDAEEKDG